MCFEPTFENRCGSDKTEECIGLFGLWLHLRGIIFQTIYGNQPYIEEAIYLKITLRNMFIQLIYYNS